MLADFNLQFNMRKGVMQKRGCYILVPFPMYLGPTVGTRGVGGTGTSAWGHVLQGPFWVPYHTAFAERGLRCENVECVPKILRKLSGIS